MKFACTCGDLGARLDRRSLLLGAGAASAMLVLQPRFVLAASGKYDAMILGCIDPRMHEPVRNFAVQHGLIGQYSQFTVAGAAIGEVAPAVAAWHKAFWVNLATS